MEAEKRKDRVIVISHPEKIEAEHDAIEKLFEEGLEIFHLRKPNFSLSEMHSFLEKIANNRYSQITLHDHFELSANFPVGGLHLNRRNNCLPANFGGRISCSCHSFCEVDELKTCCHYVFLSPIFDSISKQNYNATFDLPALEKAAAEGIIDEKVIALGGISPENKDMIRKLHFGGFAVLGYLWEDFSASQNMEQLVRKFKLLSGAVC